MSVALEFRERAIHLARVTLGHHAHIAEPICWNEP
jgi:hypothetical protein